LEVYSKLATVFSLLTLARNRVEFYLENVFWRRHISTQLIFFNRFMGAYLFYDQIVRLLKAEPFTVEECRAHLEKTLPREPRTVKTFRAAIGHGCSTFGKERMLSAKHWVKFLKDKGLAPGSEVHFLGSAEDKPLAGEIIALGQKEGLDLQWLDHCGQSDLPGSLRLLREMDEFWGIDSSLHHFARLFGVPCVSFWGPTAPQTRLRPVTGLKETVRYQPISCSPCIHVAEAPPCRGNNLCVQGLFEPVDESPTWVVSS
jgi:ADP-heptose:LPS heptosyltransferase